MTKAQDEALIETRDLSLKFPGGNLALSGIDLKVQRGEFLAILGPSGCGKSTLLRVLAGLLPPTSGHLKGLSPGDKSAFVFQKANLLPWRPVQDNLNLPLELRGEPRDAKALSKALDAVGLAGHGSTYPHALSGGMAMRVSIARALITDPQILFMDEPFGALDDMTRHKLGRLTHSLWQAQGWTTLFVTHNIYEASLLAERVIVLSQSPGRIHQDLPLPWHGVPFEARRQDPQFAKRVNLILEALHGQGDDKA